MTARQGRWCAWILVGFVWLLVGCAGDGMHRGRLPFALMEVSPRAERRVPVSAKGMPAGFEWVITHEGGAVSPGLSDQIQAGDVVTFFMSHREALAALLKGGVQKIPYEWFQYGHLAVVVPDPGGSGERRLLQVAMKQAVNAAEGLDYLDGKRWQLFRPPSGFVDVARLGEFAGIACERAGDPETAYDYPGVTGWKNAPFQPVEHHEIGYRFSCATLVVAALHYAGYELDAVHRGGRFDVVTPRQVIRSRGWRR